MIGRLPEPARTPAMRPSWPEGRGTRRPLSLCVREQSYLWLFSRRAVRDGEHRIAYPVLLHGRGDDVRGERCVITTVHRAVHFFVHLHLKANSLRQNEMHSEKSRPSHTAWLGVGLERPRIHCHGMRGGRSSPTIAGCAMSSRGVSKGSGRAKPRPPKWYLVKEVILTLFSSVYSDFFRPHTLQVSLGEGVEPECPRKAAKCEQLKRAGATPEFVGRAAQNCAPGRSRPVVRTLWS